MRKALIGLIFIVLSLIPSWIWVKDSEENKITVTEPFLWVVFGTSFIFPVIGSHLITTSTARVKSNEGILGLLWTTFAGIGIWFLSWEALALLPRKIK